MWFIYDPEGNGYEEFATEQEASTCVEAYRKAWEDDAKEEGEWFDDGLPYLRWGKVIGMGKLVKPDRPGNRFNKDVCDGILENV